MEDKRWASRSDDVSPFFFKRVLSKPISSVDLQRLSVFGESDINRSAPVPFRAVPYPLACAPKVKALRLHLIGGRGISCAIDHSLRRSTGQTRRGARQHLPFSLPREKYSAPSRSKTGPRTRDLGSVRDADGRLYNHLFERVARSGFLGTL
jgi:hypothetical protein